MAVVFVNAEVTAGQVTLQPSPCARAYNLGVDVELRFNLGLPLIAQMRRADNAEAKRIATDKKFPCDQCGLDGLANAHVVRDKHSHSFQL